MRARVTMVLAAAAMTVGGLAPVASAQVPVSATAPLEVVSRSFTHPDGTPSEVFQQGALIHGFLTLRNTGPATVTGISGALEFARGQVSVATATWPDLGPGEEAANVDPFVFRWRTSGADDASCFILLDQQVPPEEIVDDVEANTVRAIDPALDPSDPFEPIPPGDLVWRIASDLGTLEFTMPFTAVCAVAAHGAGGGGPVVRDTLATTGLGSSAVALLGLGFLGSGLGLRRRARTTR